MGNSEASYRVQHQGAASRRRDTVFKTFTPTEDFFTPDCEQVPFPVPVGGALEDEDGARAPRMETAHLLVVRQPTRKLYEMWRADMSNGFKGGCATVWDLDKAVGPSGRGNQCTSSDAGDTPVSAMVFTADEVASGWNSVQAIRFLPNSRIRRGTHHPGLARQRRHPRRGRRAALRSALPAPGRLPDEDLPSDGARVIARAMQKYGMLLADGDRLAAASDEHTQHKWAEVGVDANSVAQNGVRDMEVVGMSTPIRATSDCER